MFAAKRRMIIVFVFVVQCLTQHTLLGWFVSWVCVGGFSVEGTPGPVPIPVAKLDCADGTAIVGLWESKTPPTHLTSYLHNMWGVWTPVGVIPVGVPHTPHFCFRRRKAFLTSHRCITA